jgi:hypothetical protein
VAGANLDEKMSLVEGKRLRAEDAVIKHSSHGFRQHYSPTGAPGDLPQFRQVLRVAARELLYRGDLLGSPFRLARTSENITRRVLPLSHPIRGNPPSGGPLFRRAFLPDTRHR